MEDDPQLGELTGGMLASLGYKFDLARDGAEAVQFYRRYFNIGRPYDAVLLDLTIIGGMGGEDCFRALRDLDPDVRAVVASGDDSEGTVQRHLALGFCGSLPKPYRVGELARIIKKVTGG